MYKVDQHIFQIQINSNFKDGVLFTVRELKISQILNRGLTTVSYVLSNPDGSINETVHSANMPGFPKSSSYVSFGYKYYADSFTKLDVILETCWRYMREIYLDPVNIMEEDLRLLNLPVDEFLEEQGIDYEEVMKRVRFAVGEGNQINTSLGGYGNLYLQFQYSPQVKFTDRTDIQVVRINILPNEEKQRALSRDYEFHTELEDYELEELIESSFESEGSSIATVYEYEYMEPYVSNETTELIPITPNSNEIIVQQDFDWTIPSFSRQHYIPCRADMTEEEFYKAYAPFFEVVREKMIPFVSHLREIGKNLSRDFSYAVVEQFFFD